MPTAKSITVSPRADIVASLACRDIVINMQYLSGALELIHQLERKPWLLDKGRTGAMLSVDVGEAALLVADDAARRRDVKTLSWLWDLLIYDFNFFRERPGSGASFIDLYEYVTDLGLLIKDGENPFENSILMQYRQSIVDDLEEVRAELGNPHTKGLG